MRSKSQAPTRDHGEFPGGSKSKESSDSKGDVRLLLICPFCSTVAGVKSPNTCSAPTSLLEIPQNNEYKARSPLRVTDCGKITPQASRSDPSKGEKYSQELHLPSDGSGPNRPETGPCGQCEHPRGCPHSPSGGDVCTGLQ